jgi:hypothetical protein
MEKFMITILQELSQKETENINLSILRIIEKGLEKGLDHCCSRGRRRF